MDQYSNKTGGDSEVFNEESNDFSEVEDEEDDIDKDT